MGEIELKMKENANVKKKIVKFPDKWTEELSRTNEGIIKSSIDNIVLILENDEKFKGKLKMNEHSNRIEVFNEGTEGKSIQDLDGSIIKSYIEKKYGLYNEKKFNDALVIAASKHKYNPIKEYLESLVWDGEKRVDTAFADYFGAKPTPYNAMCMRLILMGAIERIYEPRL